VFWDQYYNKNAADEAKTEAIRTLIQSFGKSPNVVPALRILKLLSYVLIRITRSRLCPGPCPNSHSY
jgi:hypothetical protein